MFSLMKSFLKGKLPLGSLQEGHRFFDASRLHIYLFRKEIIQNIELQLQMER